MKKVAIPALAFCLLLAGCRPGNEGPDTDSAVSAATPASTAPTSNAAGTTPQQQPTIGEVPQANHEAFLGEVHKINPTLASPANREKTLQVGRQVCADIQAGTTNEAGLAGRVAGRLGSAGVAMLGISESRQFTQAAQEHLCKRGAATGQHGK